MYFFYLGGQGHGLFKCVTSGQEAAEAQKGTPSQAGTVDPLVVIGAFDAKDAHARAYVDQHEGVDGGPGVKRVLSRFKFESSGIENKILIFAID